MKTVLIQVKNQKASKLLENLEELDLIKILRKNISSEKKLSEKYAGKLSSEVADELQNHVAESRNEWKR